MAAARIGDRDLGSESTKQSSGLSRSARFSAAIASPVAVLTLLPLLVASIGLFLTVVGQSSLRDSNSSMAVDRIDEETTLLARGISAALEQSTPVMDRLVMLAQDHDSIKGFDRAAHSLRDLMQGRPGVSYISISFPDGTFQGAYRDEDGTIRFQDSRVTPQGTIVKRYTLVGHERITPYYEERNSYDPRTRDFYKLAVSSGRRVWTKPYPFFKTHYTGITRVEPVFESGSHALHAVITVDFDVMALSAVLSRTSMGGAATLLYTRDGTVLAYPSGEGRINDLPLRQDRALLYSDLDDPLLNAFFKEFVGKVHTESGASEIDVNGAKQLVVEKSIGSGGELGWSVATIMPEARILSALHQHQQKSTIAAALATLVATGMAWLFARHILRTRREVAVARAEAREAVARAQELGSYRLVEMLGKGGMGEVWRAEHRLLVRQAAIKLISMGDDAGLDANELQERFRREAQSLATLRSRNTIELFDYGVTAEGTCFYVMELLDGMDLETLVETYGPQPAARVIDFLIQACNSLAEAHDAGMVHRDIKPANLYVCRIADEVDVLKVLDFGLVRAAVNKSSLRPPTSGTHPTQNEAASGVHPGAGKRLEENAEASERLLAAASSDDAGSGNERLTQVGQAMGTPAYMAPEQALGYELDGRADLYALGCIGFFLLSGRLLFERNGSLPMMMAHITDAPPEFKNRISNYLPAELATVLMQCLAKKPHDRPNDARALAALLRAIEIPQAQEWTDAQAQAWWATRKPRTPVAEHVDPTLATEFAHRGVA